jgi:hypothetical protein
VKCGPEDSLNAQTCDIRLVKVAPIGLFSDKPPVRTGDRP